MILPLLCLCCALISSIAQDSTVLQREIGSSFDSALKKQWPQLHYSYNESKQVYDYSGNWDFDGDGKKDSLQFIGNGGAHLEYFPRIVLTGSEHAYQYSYLLIDMPFPGHSNEIKGNKMPPILPAFVVDDFNRDGLPDVYLNIGQNVLYLPRFLRNRDAANRCILLYCSRGRLLIQKFSLASWREN